MPWTELSCISGSGGPRELTVHLEIEPVGSYLRQYVMFITKVINPWDLQVLDSRCRCPAYYSECVAWPLPLVIKLNHSWWCRLLGIPGHLGLSGQTVVNRCLREVAVSLMKFPSPTESLLLISACRIYRWSSGMVRGTPKSGWFAYIVQRGRSRSWSPLPHSTPASYQISFDSWKSLHGPFQSERGGNLWPAPLRFSEHSHTTAHLTFRDMLPAGTCSIPSVLMTHLVISGKVSGSFTLHPAPSQVMRHPHRAFFMCSPLPVSVSVAYKATVNTVCFACH